MKKVVKLTATTTINQVSTVAPDSAYIHIPFCHRRCYYCDFPITVVGDRYSAEAASPLATEYVKFLTREIVATPKPNRQPLKTIFFGGGTPSLLPVFLLEKILATLEQQFGIAEGAEISIEIDPRTFSLSQLQEYARLGINRISLGAQSFDAQLLQICGRTHSPKDIFTAVDWIRQVGITNLSLDLISGLPHQSLRQWQTSLQTAIDLSPEHLSCYDLVLEPVTAFGKQYRPGVKPLPDDVTTAQMYRLAQQILTAAGYQHYEISNYARAGYQCRHNRTYWLSRPYYAFGMGAASYVAGRRFTRPRTRREYYAWVEQFEATGLIDAPQLSSTDRLLETLMLGLRLAEGVDLTRIDIELGDEKVERLRQCTAAYQRQGWVEWSEPECNIRLTDPEGFLFSNTILATIFEAFDF